MWSLIACLIAAGSAVGEKHAAEAGTDSVIAATSILAVVGIVARLVAHSNFEGPAAEEAVADETSQAKEKIWRGHAPLSVHFVAEKGERAHERPDSMELLGHQSATMGMFAMGASKESARAIASAGFVVADNLDIDLRYNRRSLVRILMSRDSFGH